MRQRSQLGGAPLLACTRHLAQDTQDPHSLNLPGFPRRCARAGGKCGARQLGPGDYMPINVTPARLAAVVRPLPGLLRLAERANGRVRGLWLKLRLVAIGGHVGKRLSVAPNVQAITVRGAHWHIGDRVSFGTGVILSVGKNASLTIGDDVRITHYTVIGAELTIAINDRAQVGEHSSIRDHEHDPSAFSMHAAPVICAPVSVGADAWIGRGAAILKGARIGAGAVIGANAVVRGEIPHDAVAVGVPARVIRNRRKNTSDDQDADEAQVAANRIREVQ